MRTPIDFVQIKVARHRHSPQKPPQSLQSFQNNCAAVVMTRMLWRISLTGWTARITGFCDDFRRVIRLMVPISGPIGTAANGCGLSLAELGGYASRRRGSTLKPGQPGEIVGEVGQADLGSGTHHADGPHDRPSGISGRRRHARPVIAPGREWHCPGRCAPASSCPGAFCAGIAASAHGARAGPGRPPSGRRYRPTPRWPCCRDRARRRVGCRHKLPRG